MIGHCVANEPSALADHQLHRGMIPGYQYPIRVGVDYVVLGIGLVENVLEFLVEDDLGNPCFAPAGFFEVTASSLPSTWRFVLGPGLRLSGSDLWGNPVVATWGYPELVDDPNHAAALQELDPAALDIFAARLVEGRMGPGAV